MRDAEVLAEIRAAAGADADEKPAGKRGKSAGRGKSGGGPLGLPRGAAGIGGGLEGLDRGRAIVALLEDPVGPVESVHGAGGRTAEAGAALTEAIVLAYGRPSLLVADDALAEEPASETWRGRLDPVRDGAEALLPAVGRIEVDGHPDYEWVGTGWLAEGLAPAGGNGRPRATVLVTNRHVAEVFAAGRDGAFTFRPGLGGGPMAARVDFREEHGRDAERNLKITGVLHVEPPGRGRPDLAVLAVDAGGETPAPVPLADADAAEGDLIAAVGYPAADGRRNPGPDMLRIFAGVFDVKRFAPGYVTVADPRLLGHDCTTLGGNSGSPVIDLKKAAAVGLHFGGRFRVGNSAVPLTALKRALAGVRASAATAGADEEARSISDYDGRPGYRPDFLGGGPDRLVPLPGLSTAHAADAAVVDADARGIDRHLLDYQHFSVVMSRARRLARFTAVNIDGSAEVRGIRRTGWLIDPRIGRDEQWGNELYRRNPLDRGHLVRRLDPVWGTRAEAARANEDTFHYTNSAPQHAGLNQRDWLGLEDYILQAANTKDFKACVFTGPVFRDDDPAYRGAKLPRDYWKVAAMVGPDDRLHATAYVLTQENLLGDLSDHELPREFREDAGGFRFGAFETYQVPLATVSDRTGLRFDDLEPFDPLGGGRESAPGAARRVRGPADIALF